MKNSKLASVAVLLTALVLSACQPATDDVYKATIRRTSYGIAHIVADDVPSLAFGDGYAGAEDHLCSLADQVVRARGERSRFFGRGEGDRHLQSDIVAKAVEYYNKAARELEAGSTEGREWLEGYAAGFNHYLRETGVDNVPGWCRGEPWVREITGADVAAYRRLLGLMAPRFAGMIVSAAPPGVAGAETTTAAVDYEPELEMASNGWAIGSERSASGGGMLLANPHYPWEGSNRFWEKHLTVPGDLNVYGVSLLGLPGVALGFNESVAWTHTVSAGQRFTLYSLDLVPGEPTSYFYDGEPRAMTARKVAVEVLQEDGSLSTVTRHVYFSHYGPILNWARVGWTEERVLSYRDANEDNDESLPTYLAMNRARGMDEFQKAHEEMQGILFVNTIAASKDGRAWYADVSATPNLSQATIADWRERLRSDETTALAYRRGMIVLDGSNSRDEWMDDPRARDSGIVPFAEVPQLERRDYVFNANDSYWLSNVEQPLSGYSPAHGSEGTPRSLRTRRNATTLSDLDPDGPSGEDGRFSLDELADAALSNENYAAHLLLDSVVERCRAEPTIGFEGRAVDLSAACEVLAAYDGRLNLDSRGAVLFRELITRYESSDLRRAGDLFAVDFDPENAVNTPRELADGDRVLEKLAGAIDVLDRAGFALDVALGELQYSNKNDGRIAIHGGSGPWEGVENVVRYGRNSTTLEPSPSIAPKVEGSRLLTEEGYPINSGSSFIMALEFGEQGPRAKAFLTYSESGDWTSPHFIDQTDLFSRKEWRPILFYEADIEADPNLEVTTIEARRP